MSGELRFVFDTSVIVSALIFPDSVPGKSFFAAVDQGTLLLSESLVEELTNVLNRKKFDRYVTPEERERFLALLIRDAELVEIAGLLHVCRDPKDDHILELAVSGRADFIVTGDQDLLVMHPFQQIHILTPTALLQRLTDDKHSDA